MNKEKEESPKKPQKNVKAPAKSKPFFTDERLRFILGFIITGFAVYLLISCIAYLFWWKTDQSLPNAQIVSGPEVAVRNWGGKSGHFLAKMIIGYGFGFGAFFIPAIFGTIGLRLLNFPKIKPWALIAKFTFATIILSLILGYIFGQSKGYLMSGPGGAQGYTITRWLNAFMGKPGTGIIIAVLTISYLVFALKFHPSQFTSKLPAMAGLFRKKEKTADGDYED
jgi:S-DNA-T family DNA segregation ATPase FtsK/SpoIIIE